MAKLVPSAVTGKSIITPLTSASATLIVKGWHTFRAWFPGMEGYVNEMLMKYLQISSPMARSEAKTIVRRLLGMEPMEVELVDGQYANSMSHWLESIGAQVEITRLEAKLRHEQAQMSKDAS